MSFYVKALYMGNKEIFSKFISLGSIILLCLPVVIAFGNKAQTGELVFDLEEVSAFELDTKLLNNNRFVRGQLGECSEQPEIEVNAYPAFKSDKPIYGLVRFAGEFSREDSKNRYFFAVDESAGTGQGYDRLYFDLNRDLDLTNDTPLVPLENPPDEAILDYSWIQQQVCFEYLDLGFDFGSDGRRLLEILPRLTVSDAGYPSISFVSTRVHKGEIKLAGRQYTAFLGHNYIIEGWFELPSTALHLIPKGEKTGRPLWLGADQLRAIHNISGTYYRFSAKPAGDKLFVRPYGGDFGTFKIGSGWRFVFDKKMVGSLLSKDAALAVGEVLENDWPEEVRSCRLPVGNYLPSMLNIKFGPMSISVSDNYHSDGKSRDRGGRPPLCGIKIRKNKPFVLDFSNKPDVIFASPVADYHVRPGDQLVVKAVLIDPVLDIMIPGLPSCARLV